MKCSIAFVDKYLTVFKISINITKKCRNDLMLEPFCEKEISKESDDSTDSD